MPLFNETASFLPDDPEPLVSASFACPFCLRRAVWLFAEADVDSATARCRCILCNVEWVVSLSDAQYLRLVLAPPGEILVLR